MASQNTSDDEALLRCETCGRSTPVPISSTDGRCIVQCDHCGASIYWHQCESCGLRYVGGAQAPCPVCEPEDPPDLEID